MIMPNEQKSIYKKINAVMKEVNWIQKDAKNEFHGYNYASEKAIKETLHPMLAKHGIVYSMTVGEVKEIRSWQTKRGATQCLMIINCSYEFADVETGEKICGEFAGAGCDGEDKGLYKAITGALKYILTTTFLIPTGDDPETDHKNAADYEQKADAWQKRDESAYQKATNSDWRNHVLKITKNRGSRLGQLTYEQLSWYRDECNSKNPDFVTAIADYRVWREHHHKITELLATATNINAEAKTVIEVKLEKRSLSTPKMIALYNEIAEREIPKELTATVEIEVPVENEKIPF